MDKKYENKLLIRGFLIILFIIVFYYLNLIFNKEMLSSFVYSKYIEKILRNLPILLTIVCIFEAKYYDKKREENEIFFYIIYFSLFLMFLIFKSSNLLNPQEVDFPNNIFIINKLVIILAIIPSCKIKNIILKNKQIVLISVITVTFILSMYEVIMRDKGKILDNNTLSIIIFFSIAIYMIAFVIYNIKFYKSKNQINMALSILMLTSCIRNIYVLQVYKLNISAQETEVVRSLILYVGFSVFLFMLLYIKFKDDENSILKNSQDIDLFYNILDKNTNDREIYILNKEHKVIYANQQARIEYGIDENDKDFCEKISEVYALTYCKILKTYKSKILLQLRRKKDWSGILNENLEDEMLVKIKNIFSEKYKNLYIVEISRNKKDINFEKKYIEVEEGQNLNNNFFANLAHELKTPLNIFYSIIQILDLYIDKDDYQFREAYKKYNKGLKINFFRMFKMITNLIDLTKLDSKFEKVKFNNYDIVKLCEDISISVLTYAEQKNITLIFDTEKEENVIKCNAEYMERIMLNLLSNAIKFTEENGKILVNLCFDNRYVYIKIKDNGRGIPEDKVSTIFNKFERVNKHTKVDKEGSGIGLSIVKSLVELLEGDIKLKSKEGEGSEFTVIIPNTKLNKDDMVLKTKEYTVDTQKITLELSDIYDLF